MVEPPGPLGLPEPAEPLEPEKTARAAGAITVRTVGKGVVGA
jgi:hypothetical protein